MKTIVLLSVVAFAAADDIMYYASNDCTGDAAATFSTSPECGSEGGASGCVNTCTASSDDAHSIMTSCTTLSGTQSFVMTVYSSNDCSGAALATSSAQSAPDASCNAAATFGSGSFGGALSCSGCFTGEDSITRPDGSVAPIKDVQVDDYVLAARPDGTLFYDKVFRITHFSPSASSPALKIVTKAGKMIEVTPSHYLHAGACCDPDKLTLAADLKVGDTVFVAPESVEATGLRAQSMVADEVVSIEAVPAKGEYNIHTLSSNVVVNGIAASHFTSSTTWSAGYRSMAPMWYKTLDFFTTAENARGN
jgi:hypothetical protein